MAKKFIAIILAMCLGMSMGLQALATEYEARIGETDYETFVGAVSEANKIQEEKDEDGNVISVVIELLKDIVLGEKVTIDRDITIDGNDHTITRDDDYTGTLINVNKDDTLTLDGNLTIDGGNDWTFDEEEYYQDMAEGKTVEESQTDYSHSEEDGVKATAPMINVNGEVVMKDATIENNWSDDHNGGAVFKVNSGASVTLEEGAEIDHIRSSVFGQVYGTVNIEEGSKVSDVYAQNSNGGMSDLRDSGVLNINGGEITEVRTFGPDKAGNGNGIIVQAYGEKTKVNINGGNIHDNASFCPGNGWGSVIYLNRGGDFTMTGGVIKDTLSDGCTAFAANRGTTIELLGGIIEIEKSTDGGYASLFYGDITVGEKMDIIGEEDALFTVLGDKDHDVKIDGEISGEGTMWLCTTETVTGKGTITSDVLIKADSWLETPAHVVLGGANWNCFILVDSVGTSAYLNVEKGANVTDGMVRVLESVESGDYKNAEESAAAQESAYNQADDANVTSPVNFYHRLLADQKDNIVITFDYNGGVDENGWSGCQVTGEEAFVPSSPAPAKDGYVFAGWDYAVVNDPETLDMRGLEAYENEAIGQTLRLVAKWTVINDDPIEEEEDEEDGENENEPTVIVDEPTPLDDAPSAPEEQYDVPETETIVDEEVPLADVPGLGDESAIWMLVAAFAVFGLVVINLPKRNREED